MPVSIRRADRLAILTAALLASGAASRAEATLPDTFVARLEARASMETLNAELLASRSATQTLAMWCATPALATSPEIVAVRAPGPDKPIDGAQRRRLQLGPGDEVRYRRVRLTCGGRVLSEADNWYVPSRLTRDINHALETTQMPFGKVVAPLQPTRQTFAATVLWTVLPLGWEQMPRPVDHPDAPLAIPPILFEHHAVLYDAERRPFSEVDEHYTSAVLSFNETGRK